MSSPSVSVIIPAHNAAATLPETLESLRLQTYPHWEAIIIENGSTDHTAAVADAETRRDSRIRWHQHAETGVSHARNEGLRRARHEWVLFLDADDWIVPEFLQRMMEVVLERPELDGVHCGWARVNDQRVVLWEDIGPSDEDLFLHMARTCTFAIHACVVRRQLLLQAGGFDPELRTGEDWDLWLRVTRAGARFGHVPEVMAHYRARAGSASMDAARLVRDSLVVLRRAYAPDPRVAAPVPAYANGAPVEQLPIARMQNVMWGAGLAIGLGQDAMPFLEGLAREEIGFDPVLFANCLHGAVIAATGDDDSVWGERFESLEPPVHAFLRAVEERADRANLARCALQHLERLALDSSRRARPFTLRTTHAITVEVTQPLPRLQLPPVIERVHCQIEVQGEAIGSLELPVIDGLLPADVLGDAIAAEFAWALLARFFARSLYPEFTTEKESNGWTVRRAGRVLAAGIQDEPGDWLAAHNTIGWTVFLQEVWGLPELAPPDLYFLPPRELAQFTDDTGQPGTPWVTLEISDRLRDLRVPRGRATAVLTVGGVAVAAKGLVQRRGRISARALRVAFTLECAFELCRAAVREGLLGQDWQTGGSLRQRLARAAGARRAIRPQPLTQPHPELAPGADRRVAELAAATPGAVVWPRHRDGICGTSASRRALLPSRLHADLMRLAATNGETLLGSPSASKTPTTLRYAPELFWRRDEPAAAAADNGEAAAASYDGDYFEGLFAAQADPWKYTTAYEQTKYEQTLELLPRKRYHRALEVACAEGHFTEQLAPRVDHLVATDVSPTALQRTRQRCAQYSNIDYEKLDLLRDRVTGRYDLIVCSEVLYYTGSLSNLADVADKLVRALRPGGVLVTAHAHVIVDDAQETGFTWDVPFGGKVIGHLLAHTPGLRLQRELRTPLYRIHVFERVLPLQRLIQRRRPVLQVLEKPPAPLEPDVEAHVIWGGLRASQCRTERLPILMYHRVAAEGPAALSRYRVTPAAFEAQLAHLRSAGYTSANFNEWRRAITTKHALPGKRVIITFDDGYRDFFTHAWPLLRRYGFDATVFLPTDHIGRFSSWDAAYGEPAPLMDWPEILQLDREGVQFGSHTVSHPLLTSLPPAEMAAEFLRSRALLQDYLGERILSLAYPFGDTDSVVQTMLGSCGYLFGLTCEDRPSCLDDRLLSLPRLEVRGSTTLNEFRRMLGEDLPAGTASPMIADVQSVEVDARAELSALS